MRILCSRNCEYEKIYAFETSIMSSLKRRAACTLAPFRRYLKIEMQNEQNKLLKKNIVPSF